MKVHQVKYTALKNLGAYKYVKETIKLINSVLGNRIFTKKEKLATHRGFGFCKVVNMVYIFYVRYF